VQAKLSELQIRGFVAVPGGGVISGSAMSPIGPDGSFRLGGFACGRASEVAGGSVKRRSGETTGANESRSGER